MYTCVLIDDEEHGIEGLHILLQKYFAKELEVIGKFQNPLEAYDFIVTHKPQLLFLDIEMPIINGFQLLRKLQHIALDVIFVTAYHEYAIKAFQYSAINYLLKPVDDDLFIDTINNWLHRKQAVLLTSQMQVLEEQLATPNMPGKKIALHTQKSIEIVDIQTIIRCESKSNYTLICCNTGEQHIVSRTLKTVEDVLRQNGFLRIHHSHLINPNEIIRFLKHDSLSVIMSDSMEIPVSRSRKEDMFKLMDHFSRL